MHGGRKFFCVVAAFTGVGGFLLKLGVAYEPWVLDRLLGSLK